jgi:hypothetical protein
MILAAEAGEVAAAEVIGQDQDDVRLVGGEDRERSKEEGEEAHGAEEG